MRIFVIFAVIRQLDEKMCSILSASLRQNLHDCGVVMWGEMVGLLRVI